MRRDDASRFLSLESVAECFRVDVRWIEEAYDFGLLGRGRVVERRVTISVEYLDRVADMLRLHRQGVNFAGIAMLIAFDD
jgi:hypothetical protein